jgi:outer membrane lipoprotein-sorting protein
MMVALFTLAATLALGTPASPPASAAASKAQREALLDALRAQRDTRTRMKSLRLVYRFEVTAGSGAKTSGRVELFRKQDKIRVDTVSGDAAADTLIFDGQRYFRTHAGLVQEVSADEVRRRSMGRLDVVTSWLERLAQETADLRMENIPDGGGDGYALTGQMNETTVRVWIDARSFLVSRTEMRSDRTKEPIVSIVHRYRPLDVLWLAEDVEVRDDGGNLTRLRLQDAQANPEVRDDLFDPEHERPKLKTILRELFGD